VEESDRGDGESDAVAAGRAKVRGFCSGNAVIMGRNVVRCSGQFTTGGDPVIQTEPRPNQQPEKEVCMAPNDFTLPAISARHRSTGIL
jgi:hypothetical protein